MFGVVVFFFGGWGGLGGAGGDVEICVRFFFFPGTDIFVGVKYYSG